MIDLSPSRHGNEKRASRERVCETNGLLFPRTPFLKAFAAVTVSRSNDKRTDADDSPLRDPWIRPSFLFLHRKVSEWRDEGRKELLRSLSVSKVHHCVIGLIAVGRIPQGDPLFMMKAHLLL